MSRNIPSVKLWTIKLSDGRRFNVMAPTKRLAILNLRNPASAGTWGPISSIGLLRPTSLAGRPMVEEVVSRSPIVQAAIKASKPGATK